MARQERLAKGLRTIMGAELKTFPALVGKPALPILSGFAGQRPGTKIMSCSAALIIAVFSENLDWFSDAQRFHGLERQAGGGQVTVKPLTIVRRRRGGV